MEYFGCAEDDDPGRLDDIKRHLENEGVKLSATHEGIAYSPASKGGGNACLHYEEGMSLCAWEHELDHFEYDKELGFPGIAYYLQHIEIWDAMEERAYGKEIEIAARRGENELVEKLEKNLEDDRRRRHGNSHG